MADFVKVALDAHGGDNAPAEVVKGALLALEENENLKISLVGAKTLFEKEKITGEEFRAIMEA